MNAPAVICAWLIACASAFAQPVAVVTDLQGSTQLRSADRSGPVGILTQLSAGDRVRLQDSAHLTILYYADGTQFDARGPGDIAIEASRPRALDGAVLETRATRPSRDFRLKPVGLVQGAMLMRGVSLRIESPDGTILESSPTFRWSEFRPGATYRVAVFAESGGLIHESVTQERTVRLPESVPIKPGVTYQLEVAVRDGRTHGPTAISQFRVAPEELRTRAAELAPPRDAAKVAEQVAYAVWLEQNDLREEARTWWAKLAELRPGQAALRERAVGRR